MEINKEQKKKKTTTKKKKKKKTIIVNRPSVRLNPDFIHLCLFSLQPRVQNGCSADSFAFYCTAYFRSINSNAFSNLLSKHTCLQGLPTKIFGRLINLQERPLCEIQVFPFRMLSTQKRNNLFSLASASVRVGIGVGVRISTMFKFSKMSIVL